MALKKASFNYNKISYISEILITFIDPLDSSFNVQSNIYGNSFNRIFSG